jgi:anti-anti-sigma factor
MLTEPLGNATVLRLMERVDSVTCIEVESALQGLIASTSRHVICDFSAAKYISSAGLRVIMLAAKNLKQSGRQLALVCARGNYIYRQFPRSDAEMDVQFLPTSIDFRLSFESARLRPGS